MVAARPVRAARITGADRDALVGHLARRYAAGEPIRSMAADIGRSYGFVQGLLTQAGVRLRTRGGPTRGAEALAARRAAQESVASMRAELETATAPDATPRVPTKSDKREKAGPKGKPDDRPDAGADRTNALNEKTKKGKKRSVPPR